MDEHIYVKDLQTEDMVGLEVHGVYHCKRADMVARGGNKSYYLLVLADKTGEIKAEVASYNVSEPLAGKMVEITSILGLRGGVPQLEVYTVFVKQTSSMSQERVDEIEEMLVCSLSKESALEQMKKLKRFIDNLERPYSDYALKALVSRNPSKNPVIAMSTLPASGGGAFCYNGGLLDKAIYAASLADAILETEVPEGAYPQIKPEKEVIKLAVILACAAIAGKYTSLPDNCEIIGGLAFLPTIMSVEDVEGVDVDNVKHCVLSLLGVCSAATLEAEVSQKIWELADNLAIYSYVNFTGGNYVNGHVIRKKGE